jgi:hypothetical protein
MQINEIVLPESIDSDIPYGYTPMDVAIEIEIGSNGQIGDARLKPMEIDNKTRMRRWLPDNARTSGEKPILGADKLDYYHPLRQPQTYEAMLGLLDRHVREIPELQGIADWMKSDAPLKLAAQIENYPSKGDIKTLETGRIIWLMPDGEYIHNLPKVKLAHAESTRQRAIGNGKDGFLRGSLNKIHTKRLAAPLFNCNDDMFCSWGQTANMPLNVSVEDALKATQTYTQLLETPGHHIRIDEQRYWVWGPLAEMAQISKASQDVAGFFSSAQAAESDPVQIIQDLIEEVTKGSKHIGKLPASLKIACGYIGIGGSGIGRTAIGQMSERSILELLTNLLTYHQQQRRYIYRSTPFWVFGSLTIAEGSSKKAAAKANEQIFEAMLDGRKPSPAITKAIVHRLQIEGVPNIRQKKSSRAWAQTAYLAWVAPDFIKGNGYMKPDHSPENLLAWHVGRVFGACKDIAYQYAARGEKPKDDWKNPIDGYRQLLFSSPAQGFTQIMNKVSPYLAACPSKAYWYHKAVAELGADCPSQVPPKHWTDEQSFFLALGISQMAIERPSAKTDGDNLPTEDPQ